MDRKLNDYRGIIKHILLHHAEHMPSHSQIETRPVFDEIRDSYLLLDVGWDRTGRVHEVVLDLQIKNGKIWLEVDGTEEGITQELLDTNIAREDIVIGFYRPDRMAQDG